MLLDKFLAISRVFFNLEDKNMKELYIHLRRFTRRTELNGETLLEYNARGGKTLKVEYHPKTNDVCIAWARCSEKDNYCKKTGRDTIAEKIGLRVVVVKPDELEDTLNELQEDYGKLPLNTDWVCRKLRIPIPKSETVGE